MAFNWETTTILPEWNHILVNSNAFSLELLPYNPATPGLRQIKPICNKCPSNSPKRILPLRNQYTYKLTTNYIAYLKANHKTTWQELGFNTKGKQAIPSSTASSSQTSTTGPLDQLVIQRQKAIFPGTINSKELARLTIKYIVANNLSFNTAISPTFKELIKRLNPDIVAPSQYYLYQEIDTYYTEQNQLFKQKLYLHMQNKGTFTLCLDNWTSLNQKAYLGITIHWINAKDWTLQSYILRLENLHKQHSGENLYTSLLQILKEYNIQNNIFSITRDNASNNNTLISEFR